MAEIALKGKMKVKTLKAEFKKVFGATLRVYNDVTCRGEYADDNATLASIRTEGAKGGEFSVKGNMHIGNFEKKVADLFGIGIQVANANDSELIDNNITLSQAATLSCAENKTNITESVVTDEETKKKFSSQFASIAMRIAKLDEQVQKEELLTIIKTAVNEPELFDLETIKTRCSVEIKFDSSLSIEEIASKVDKDSQETMWKLLIPVGLAGEELSMDTIETFLRLANLWNLDIPFCVKYLKNQISEDNDETLEELSHNYAIIANVVANIDGEITPEELHAIMNMAEVMQLDSIVVTLRLAMEHLGLTDYESHSAIVRKIAEQGWQDEMMDAWIKIALSDFKLSQEELDLLNGLCGILGIDWDDCCESIQQVIDEIENATGNSVEIAE